jgi:SAM-dependent methyltransferase
LNFSSDPCPACGGSAIAFSAGGRQFGLHKCGACGLVRTEPMPSDAELMEFYQGFSFRRPDLARLERDVQRVTQSLEHFVGRPRGENARFLDYGGGFGIYCLAARRLGWQPWLFDYDRGCIDFAREQLGLPHAVADLGELSGRRFDVIFGYHVIEHWNVLDANMEALLELLAPEGRIVFATPHADSLEKWVRPYHLRNYWKRLRREGEGSARALSLALRPKSFLCWDPPRHLFAFTGEALHQLGRRHGLEAKVEVGYNTSLLHEPRQDVLPGTAPGLLAGAIARFSRFGCRALNALFPAYGEQLYVTYTRSGS